MVLVGDRQSQSCVLCNAAAVFVVSQQLCVSAAWHGIPHFVLCCSRERENASRGSAWTVATTNSITESPRVQFGEVSPRSNETGKVALDPSLRHTKLDLDGEPTSAEQPDKAEALSELQMMYLKINKLHRSMKAHLEGGELRLQVHERGDLGARVHECRRPATGDV